jgi:hypothetical protein
MPNHSPYRNCAKARNADGTPASVASRQHICNILILETFVTGVNMDAVEAGKTILESHSK